MSIPTRLLASLATLTLIAGSAQLAAEQAAPPPAAGPTTPPPAGQPMAPQQRPMPFRAPGMMPSGGVQAQFKIETTIRLIMLDATGSPTPEGQKAIDDLSDEGWRTGSISTVSATPPLSIAMVFSRVHARQPMQQTPPPMQPGPMQPGPVQPVQPAPAHRGVWRLSPPPLELVGPEAW